MQTIRILMMDLDPGESLRERLKEIQLPSEQYQIHLEECRPDFSRPGFFPSGIKTLLARTEPDLLFMGFGSMPKQDYLAFFESIRAETILPVLFAAPVEKINSILDLFKFGSTDFVTTPLRSHDIFPRIMRLLSRIKKQEPVLLRLKERVGMKKMIGENPRFLEEIRKIPMMAKCDAGVLISGETGTGKEMCARVIHYLSPRSENPFIAVNCGAIPSDLIENELFGHEREAFTGASNSKPGLIKESDGGTLFLDEVDSLSPLAQVKLLRFLQEKEYRPLGSTKSLKANVRIVAASNQDLEKAANDGRMRQDLYYRLNVMSLSLPPLRERKSDIPAFLDFFLTRYSDEYRVGPFELSQEAMRRLTLFSWPGNIRQLEHTVQRAVLLAQSPVLSPADFALPQEGGSPRDADESFQFAKARLIRDFEKEYIQTILMVHKGNISRAAKTAKKNRRAFWQLMQKHGIEVAKFRPDSEMVEKSIGIWA